MTTPADNLPAGWQWGAALVAVALVVALGLLASAWLGAS